MELVNSRHSAEIASNAASNWKKQYCSHDGKWQPSVMGNKSPKEIYDSLISLGSDPDPADVDRVIGNGSWTRYNFVCFECGKSKEEAVEIEIGEGVVLCLGCLKEAVAMLEGGDTRCQSEDMTVREESGLPENFTDAECAAFVWLRGKGFAFDCFFDDKTVRNSVKDVWPGLVEYASSVGWEGVVR